MTDAAGNSHHLTPLQARWECDLSDNALRWSDGVYDLFGLERGSPITRDEILKMYLPESHAELARLRAEAIATCGSFTFEARIRRTDGEIRWMRVTADVVVENGVARTLYGTKLDVTEEMARRTADAA
ncbi:PAS domain-containing protein [Sphingomonas sp. ST-64]|uniref:histidine kinase n=1 Tax=Sphingomonas plantiphila TaxID=3163295 RepID=A0ABW8YRZ0_9SPHN